MYSFGDNTNSDTKVIRGRRRSRSRSGVNDSVNSYKSNYSGKGRRTSRSLQRQSSSDAERRLLNRLSEKESPTKQT